MRMRLGVPLLVAVVGLLGAVRPAAASNCGADKYTNCGNPCCEAQCCFSSCQQQCRITGAAEEVKQRDDGHPRGTLFHVSV